MASLETVVFQQDPFGYYSGVELYGSLVDGRGEEDWVLLDDFEVDRLGPLDFGNILDSRIEQLDGPSSAPVPEGVPPHLGDQLCLSSYPNYPCSSSHVEVEAPPEAAAAVGERPKRRRGRSRKNKEEIEIQRMTHIAVERNRRKQMNEYLSVLRSLMPESYVPRVCLSPLFLISYRYQKAHCLCCYSNSSP